MKTPEFRPKPAGPKEDIMGDLKAKDRILMEKAGLSEAEFTSMKRICDDAFSKNFPPSSSGRIDGSASIFMISDIEKVSEGEIKVVGKGQRGSGVSLGAWEMKVTKSPEGEWTVEEATEQ